ncbi:MAG: pitrilysin family protein [Polyangiaceae bacterium]
MKLFVERSAKLPVVSIALGFRSGSSQDPPGLEGLARTTARMLRRGCRGMTADEIEDTIDSLGGEFGADAMPSATTLHAEVISRKLGSYLDVVSRLLGEPTFAEDELGRLLREAKAELVDARDSDRTLASRAFRRTLFEGHPYGRRVAGSLTSLDAIKVEHVWDFYRRHYTQANAVVAVSGDITESGAHELAARLVGGLPAGEPIPQDIPDPTPAPGRRLVLVDKPERTQTEMVMGWTGTDARDDDHVAWLVGNTGFSGMFTSRLMQEVRAKRGWSYGASSRVGFDRHRDAFTMWTAPSATDAPPCLELELELLANLRESGLTPDELAFTKSYLKRSHAFEVDTPRKRVHQPFEEALFDLPEGYHARYLARVGDLTLEEVNAALAKRTPCDDLVIAVVATESETGDALRARIPNLTRATVAPFDLE